MPSIASIVVSIVAGGAVIVGGSAAYSAMAGGGPDQARVVKVVDGDTIDVRYDGSEHRVRLLNIDTPETKHPGKAVECLGPEATQALSDLLQPGDVVRLEFDVELYDRYDRELAGVFEDDLFINAELARRGLGRPVLFEPNRKFYDEVVAAYEEGKTAEAGMFSPDLTCTFASRTQEYEDAVVALEAQAGGAPGEVKKAADGVVSDGEALILLLAASAPGSLDAAGLTVAELDAMRVHVDGLMGRAVTVSAAAGEEIERAAEAAEKKREADEAAEKKAAEEAEAERKAAEEAEAQKKAAEKAEEEARIQAEEAAAEAQRQADAAAQAEAERQAQAQRQAQAAAEADAARRAQEQQPQQPAPPPPSAPLPGAGYTGCRAYIGGPYVDDQGRFYTPIDCQTKQPLVP